MFGAADEGTVLMSADMKGADNAVEAQVRS